ncbi:MAG: Ppx/GppA family phosphatase [Ilumatobacter sp.]|nr:MAG: Ppx/GppA family phosphatase [Ilumatobacter sp.]
MSHGPVVTTGTTGSAPTTTTNVVPDVFAALDLGTNSFHLVVARHTGGEGFDVITREREMVRLGHGGTDMKELSDASIDRAVACLRRMRRIAESHGASEIRTVATSATREAANASAFIERARDEAGVEIEVISGLEEARLIHLGILQAVPVFDQRVLLVDIGGGSTEILIGERGETLAARSFKLGAVRLTDRFFPDGEVSDGSIADCREYIRSVLTHFEREADEYGFDVAVASSGTAEAIARMVHAHRGGPALRTFNCFEFTRDELTDVVERLCAARSPQQRAKISGLDSGRADIAPAGALILDEIAERFGADAFTFSEGALRDGVLLDAVERRSGGADGRSQLRDVARRSIRQLRDRCDDDPAHSAQVARLAVELFDGLEPLHGLGPAERDLLEAGALLANVGLVVSHSKHHHHSYYVVRNSELTGLTDHEIELIAQIARYHRKSNPKSSHEPFAALSRADQQLVRTLAGILRIAIGLDRCHERRVPGVRVELGDQRVTIEVGHAGADIALELYAANERKDLLEQVLDRRVELMPVVA